jgi:hypothetical protein
MECPICFESLSGDVYSTTCGHIFDNCINAFAANSGKCPTCLSTLAASQVHKIYLPINVPDRRKTQDDVIQSLVKDLETEKKKSADKLSEMTKIIENLKISVDCTHDAENAHMKKEVKEKEDDVLRDCFDVEFDDSFYNGGDIDSDPDIDESDLDFDFYPDIDEGDLHFDNDLDERDDLQFEYDPDIDEGDIHFDLDFDNDLDERDDLQFDYDPDIDEGDIHFDLDFDNDLDERDDLQFDYGLDDPCIYEGGFDNDYD